MDKNNKINEIKILLSNLINDVDSLGEQDFFSIKLWEDILNSVDIVKNKLHSIKSEEDRLCHIELVKKIDTLKLSIESNKSSVTNHNTIKRQVANIEHSAPKLFIDDEEALELFDDNDSILDSTRQINHAWKRDMPGTKIDDLNKAISLNDKLCFIKELFNDDQEQYRLSIQKLNEMSTMSEALEYTRNAFAEWDEESTIIYRFYMILRRKLDV